MAPTYKANRTAPRPKHWEACRQFLVTHHKAKIVEGYEADDALGMEQRDNGTTICSIDKDMLQLPGRHYNFVRKEFYDVTPDQGLKSFYTQSLVGDTSDNIIGVPGIGPKKAAKLLDPLLPEEYYEACKNQYDSVERFHTNCKLLWIWRKPHDVWSPPYDKVA